MKNFKEGDDVILVVSNGIHTLELNHAYNIKEIIYKSYKPNDIFFKFENDELLYNSKRFKKDIKFIRRKKNRKDI